jgi:drug/metabolite transporter (DMT)-like permease
VSGVFVLRVLGVGVLALVWGTQFLVIKIGLETVPPLLAVSLRFAVLAVVGAVFAAILRVRAAPGTGRFRLALGLTQARSFALLYWAQARLATSVVAVLDATSPWLVALLAHRFVPGERMDRRTVVSLSIGLAGVVAVSVGQAADGSPELSRLVLLLPMAAVVLGALASASNKVLAKRLVSNVAPAVLLRDMGAVVALVTAAMWLLLQRHAPVHLGLRAVAAFSYLGLVASAGASALYLVLLRRARVTSLSHLQFVVPVVATVTGLAIGGERMRPAVLVGAACVVVGLFVQSTRPRVT